MMKKGWLILLGMVLVLTACSGGAKKTSSTKIADFTFTDQAGKPFGLADLKGKTWLANFVFTNCTTVCQPMTFNLAGLQQDLKEKNIDATIVSFSVDPDRDKPEVLNAFADKFNVDYSNWRFLTGYAFEDIQELAKGSFRTLVEKDPNSDQMIHGTSILLISSEGYLMKYYDGVSELPVEEIAKDIRAIT